MTSPCAGSPFTASVPCVPSRAKGFCACQGLRRRGVGLCLAISTPAMLPSVGRKTSAPRTCLTPLNTSPAPSPVNASRLTSRTARASLGAGAVRYSFTATDFHRLPFAGLPAHPSTTSEAATDTHWPTTSCRRTSDRLHQWFDDFTGAFDEKMRRRADASAFQCDDSDRQPPHREIDRQDLHGGGLAAQPQGRQ
jgi:hypothetical protein